MISKYENPFDGLDTGGIAGKISNFITALNNINYESSGCFMMSTNAAYDSTFNDAVNKLKTNDIKGMTDCCSRCLQEVIAKIVEFNSYYDGTYTSDYDAYKTAYETFINTPKEVSAWSFLRGHYMKHNPKYDDAEDAKDAAEKDVKDDHIKMNTDVDAINSVSFEE